MSSLFERLRRYPRTPLRDAREDRLTEALAVTLEAAPDAARHLVQNHFEVRLSGSGKVATQVRSPGLRVDLQLCFGSLTRPELLVWFEAKVCSRACRNQGKLYMQELERQAPGGWGFTWLMRGEREVEGGMPDGAKCLTWQQLGAWLKEWLHQQGDSLEMHGPRIVSEFLDHLEKEENLAYTQRLEKSDASVLGAYDVARGRLDELLRQAKALVNKDWGCPDSENADWSSQQTSPGLPDFHLLLLQRGRREAESGWPDSCYFEWHGRLDHAREHPDGSWILGTGATMQATAAPNETESSGWFRKIRREGFEVGQGGHKGEYGYIFRYLTLEQLTEECDGRDVGTQATQLAEWVTASLRMLNRIGPPTPDANESDERNAFRGTWDSSSI